MVKKQQLGYCGLDCLLCPVFIATRNDDMALRIRTAEEWSKLYAEYLGGNSLEAEAMNCHGCRSDGEIFVGCAGCLIRQCCRGRNLTSCAVCDEYFTCEMINGFFSVESNRQAKDNLDNLRSNS